MIQYLPVVLGFLIAGTIRSQETNRIAQSTMTFLSIDPVARTVGMGEASTCMDNDVNALFHNPAGIAKISGAAIALNHTRWIADMNQYSISTCYGHSLLGTFGASFVLMDNGEIVRTVPDASTRGFHTEEPFNVNQFAVGIGYGRQITNKFSIGGQVKYAYQDLGPADIYYQTVSVRDTLYDVANHQGTVALDFGTLYYIGLKDLRVAMSFRNFSSSVEYGYDPFQLPLVLRIGMAMNVLALFPGVENQSLQMAVEAAHPNDYSDRIHVGGEYGYRNLFFVRAGYRFNSDEKGLSAGLGVSYATSTMTVKIDYAYSDYGNLFGAVHRVSFGFRL